MSIKFTRKRFLDLLLGAGGAGVAFVTAYPLLIYLVPPKRTVESGEWVDAGPLDEIKQARSKDILSSSGIPIIVVYVEEGKVVALEKKCPHLGCMVELQGKELDCPCHGAKFTLDGQLTGGPSPRGLKQYKVETRGNGNVFVGKEVG